MSVASEFVTRTKAGLRVFGDTIDPDSVSSNIGFTGDHQHRAGDLIGSSLEHKYKTNVWLTDSKSPPGATLEVHLDEILSRVEFKQAYLRSLAEYATVDFYCVIFWNIGFQLHPHILSRIASLGATFGVVIYNSDSDGLDADASTSAA